MAIRWRADDGPLIVLLGSSPHQLKKKNVVEVGPLWQNFLDPRMYEGCSNMNASSFITFFTYMLRQNGKRFYKGLYVTFKLAPELKQKIQYTYRAIAF